MVSCDVSGDFIDFPESEDFSLRFRGDFLGLADDLGDFERVVLRLLRLSGVELSDWEFFKLGFAFLVSMATVDASPIIRIFDGISNITCWLSVVVISCPGVVIFVVISGGSARRCIEFCDGK